MTQPFNFKPTRCILELGYNCNLRCRTCINWKKPLDLQIDVPKLKNTQKELAHAGVERITYLGGEPFLNKALPELAASAKESGLLTAVVTNGTVVSPQIDPFDILIFSVDGPESVHDAIRGVKGTYQKVSQTIERIQKLKKQKKDKRPKVYVYVTVSSLNYQYLEDMLLYAQKLDVNALRFLSVSCINDYIIEKTNELFKSRAINSHSYKIDDELKIPEKEVPGIRKRLLDIKERAKKIGLKLFIEECLINKTAASSCGFLGKDFVITANGDVLPCPMLPQYSIGNINESSVEEILGSGATVDKVKYIYELSSAGKLPVCKQCCVEKVGG